MAEDKPYNVHSVTPVSATQGATIQGSKLTDLSLSNATDAQMAFEKSNKQLAALGKAEERDGNWSTALHGGIGFVLGTAQMFSSAGKALEDEKSHIRLPEKFDWVGGLSIIDSVLSLISPDYDESHSLVKAAGFKSKALYGDKIADKVDVLANDSATPEESNAANKSLDDQYAAQEREYFKSKEGKDTTIPLFIDKPVNWLLDQNQKMVDVYHDKFGESSFKPFTAIDNFITRSQEWNGPINSKYDALNWLGNEFNGIAPMVVGNLLMGTAMGSIGQKILSVEALNTSKAIQDVSKAVVNAGQSLVGVAGLNVMVGDPAYREMITSNVDYAGGEEYLKGRDEKMEEAKQEYYKLNPDITPGNRGLKMYLYDVGNAFQQKWLDEHPDAAKVIIAQADKGLQALNAQNTLSTVLQMVKTSMYLKGKVATRGEVLTNPTKWEWKQTLKSSAASGATMMNIDIATELGKAVGTGGDYDISSAADFIFSKKGAGTFIRGSIMGMAEGAIKARTSYDHRLAQFKAQKEILEDQNKIGNAESTTIDKFIALGHDYKSTAEITKRIQTLLEQEEGGAKEAAMQANRLLSIQARTAFESGTTKNLLDNYDKVVGSDKFSKEARDAASEAIDLIKDMEKTYNESSKYINADKIYETKIVRDAYDRELQREELNRGNVQGKGLEAVTKLAGKEKFDKSNLSDSSILELLKEKTNPFVEATQKDLHALYGSVHPTKVVNGELILHGPKEDLNAMSDVFVAINHEDFITRTKDTINKLFYEEAVMKSPQTQRELFAYTVFHNEVAKYINKEISTAKKNNKKYDAYGDENFLRFFEKKLEFYKPRLNEKDYASLEKYHENQKKLSAEQRLEEEKKVAAKIVEDANNEKAIKDAAERAASGIKTEEPIEGTPPVKTETSSSTEESAITSDVKAVVDLLGKPPVAPDESVNKTSGANFTAEEETFNFFTPRGNVSQDPRIISDNMSEEAKNQLKEVVGRIYENLKTKIENPTFEDLLTRFSKELGYKKAEQCADGLMKAWIYNELPGYKDLNFNNIQQKFFQSERSLYESFANLIDKLPAEKTEEENLQEIQKGTEAQDKQLDVSNGNGVITHEDGTVTYEALGNILSTPVASLAYRGTDVTAKYKTLTEGDQTIIETGYTLISEIMPYDVNAPGAYKVHHVDMYKPGTLLLAKVHPNFNDVPVYNYDKEGRTNGVEESFQKWLDKTNMERKAKGEEPLIPESDEYIKKVPIAVVDADGDIIGYVPDMGRISLVHNTPSSIKEYGQSVLDIRKKVMRDKNATLIITERTPGYSKELQFPNGELKTIDEAGDMHSIMAVKRAKGLEFVAGQKEIPESDIIWSEIPANDGRLHPIDGYTYELRRAGVVTEYNSDGTIKEQRPKYFPFYTFSGGKLSEEAQSTIYWGVNAYLNKGNAAHPDINKITHIARELRERTQNQINIGGNDDIIQLDKLIKMFAFTNDKAGSSAEDVIRQIEETASSSGTPFIFTQKGVVVIGTAFPRVDGLSMTHSYKSNQAGIDFMEKLKLHLPELRMNVSDHGMRHKGAVPVIDAEGNVRDGYENYDQYIRTNVKTRAGTVEVPITRDGKEEKFMASFVQPRIDFVLTDAKIGEKEIVNVLKGEKTSDEILQKIVDDVLDGKKLNDDQTIIKLGNKERFEQLLKETRDKKPVDENQVFDFMGEKLTKEQMQEKVRKMNEDLLNSGLKGKKPGATSQDPIKLEDNERQEVIDSSQLIKGILPSQQADLTSYIYNQIAMSVNASEKGISLEQVRSLVKNVFDNNIQKRISDTEATTENLKAVLVMSPDMPYLEDSIARWEERTALYKLVQKNWSVFEEDALAMVKKYKNIKEKVNTFLEDENGETGRDESLISVDTDRETGFDQSSLQVSGKDSVSAHIKDLCEGITQIDSNGNDINSVFGTPKYIGFDEIFNNVSAWLAEKTPEWSVMKETLEKYEKSNKWIPQLLDKLDPNRNAKDPVPFNKSVQNEFVSAMSKHALDMEFVMMSKDRHGNFALRIYSTNSAAIARSLISNWKSNILTSGLVVGDPSTGNHVYNLEAIKKTLQEYKDMKESTIHAHLDVENTKTIKGAIENYLLKNPKIDQATFFSVLDDGKASKRSVTATTEAKRQELVIALEGAKKKFTMTFGTGKDQKQVDYTVDYDSEQKTFAVRKYVPTGSPEIVKKWLENFGIEIAYDTAEEIVNKGFRYDSKTNVRFEQQWSGEVDGKGTSLLGTLAGTLEQIRKKIEPEETEDTRDLTDVIYDESDISGDKILGQTIISSLAKMDARYTTHRVVQSFYDNHKSIYAFTASKFITDRVRELKAEPTNNSVTTQLQSTSFSKNSMWLKFLQNNPQFRNDDFRVIHLGLTALKELGKVLYRDNEIQRLSDSDHALTKLGFFQPDQGDISTKLITDDSYTGLKFRIARMFSPTAADKSTMTIIKTVVLDLDRSTVRDNYNKVLDFAYGQIVTPELERIVNFHKKVGKTNIKDYDKGAQMFLMMPALNRMKFNYKGQEISLLTLLSEKGFHERLKVELNGKEKTVKEHIKDNLDAHIQNEKTKTLALWKRAKFTNHDADGKIIGYNFLDKSYLNKRGASDIAEKIDIAALDFSLNSLIANANSFMTIAGDPATAFKPTGKGMERDVKETLKNVVKRLADQIAPRNKLANSETNKYIQLFMGDTFIVSKDIKYKTKALDKREITDEELRIVKESKITERKTDEEIIAQQKEAERIIAQFPKSKDYFNVESTNAQEYTTWKEHLYILENLGKIPESVVDISQAEIEQAREIFSGNKKLEDLTPVQQELIQKVLQPMKPVYTGQVYSPQFDMMRKMYIKTSAFPLLPQLTHDFEINKLRETMERIEQQTGKTVRASYTSGNKLGAIADPYVVADKDGNFYDHATNRVKEDGKTIESNEEVADRINSLIDNYTLELPRSNFGIQQNVPIKSDAAEYDVISRVTQASKLLFANVVMSLKDFGKGKKSGEDLHKEFFELHDSMIKDMKNNLYAEAGINPSTGLPINEKKTLAKLSRILQREATLRGYPKQDLDALAINDETGTFNLPIWLSPNSSRYEALLSSIVSHRIVKVKFPGYSYVTGSENGFKTRTDLEDINKSRVVYTDKWEGHLKSNQVLIPCKIRVNGTIIDLTSPEYSTRDASGKLMIRTDKVSSELLENIPSFRIPNSKHSSMENLEIAGFLPKENADLIIVSSDNTVSMSEDYDVDKRYTYHQWTTTDKTGKIIPLQQADKYQEEGKTPIQVARELLASNEQDVSDLRKSMKKISVVNEKLQEAIDDVEVLEKRGKKATDQEIIDTQKRIDKLTAQLDVMKPENVEMLINELRESVRTTREDINKLHQNEIVRIHSDVLNHPEVKKMTNEKLSVDDAKEDARFLEEITAESEEFFTPLSDSYQRNKVLDGAVGKNGTAAYSLDVVSHSLFEQSLRSGKPVRLMEFKEAVEGQDGEIHPEVVNLNIRFGNFMSDGTLGMTETLDGARSTGDVIAERQQLSVDNQNEQIAYRVNLNDYTMKVDKVLNLLRFDKGEDGRSISFLFISQPIIKEYVARMEMQNSNTSDYNPNKKKTTVNELFKSLGYEAREAVDNKDSEMTNAEMINQIRNGGADKAFQAAVLDKFLKLEGYGDQITSVQTLLNVDSKGIGKNLLETIEKLQSIKNLADNKIIQGASNLIGDYKTATNNSEVRDLQDQGYIIVDKNQKASGEIDKILMIKPETVAGVFAINGLVTANEIWGTHFPYELPHVKTIFREAMSIFGNSEMSDTRKVELKQDIFNEMKKYLYTDPVIGRFENDLQTERFRLFIDLQGKYDTTTGKFEVVKQSLAHFMSELHKSPSEEVKKLLKSNMLLNRFQYEINTNGKPSLIKFNNAQAENFNEQYMYNSIIELVEADLPLGKFNGKDYTSSDLAHDLVAYSYLGSPIQEAIQFIKFIPVSYLKAWGINKISGFVGRETLGVKRDKSGILSTYTKQYIQHRAAQVKKITVEDMTSSRFKATMHTAGDLSTLKRFTFDQSDVKTPEPFFSIYNEKLPKGQSKHQLYQYDKETGEYVRIPTLGAFGMSEYMAEKENYSSLINQPKNLYEMIDAPSLNESLEAGKINRFNVNSKDPKKIVDSIAQIDSPMGKLAKELAPLVSRLTKFELSPSLESNGEFNRETNTIFLNKNLHDGITSDENLARVILRETIHSITDMELAKYVKQLPVNPETGGREFTVTEGASDSIKRLASIFNEVQKELAKNDELKKLMTKEAPEGGFKEKLTDQEYNVTYGGYNIFEFVERMMTSPEFQAKFDKIKFKDSEKTIGEKFREWVSNVLAEVKKSLGLDLTEGNITAEALKSIYKILEEKQQKQTLSEDLKSEKLLLEANKLLEEIGSKKQQTGSIEDLLGRPPTFDKEAERTLFDDEGGMIDEDQWNKLKDNNTNNISKDPKSDNFDLTSAAMKDMLLSGRLKIKC